MQTHRAPRGHPQRIACVNKTRHVTLGVAFGRLTAALQKCYDRHFLPVWGFPVKLYNTRKPRPGDWQMLYMDDADQADAEGYHDLTHKGVPVSYVFVKSVLLNHEPVSLTACHELFEMVIDPIANLWADGRNGWQYAYEMCDPVEEDTFLVDGLTMSNFVYPTWFEPFAHRRGTKYDHLGRLQEPFGMTHDGYVIRRHGHKVYESFASHAKKKRFGHENRRGHRSEYRKADGSRLRKKVSK